MRDFKIIETAENFQFFTESSIYDYYFKKENIVFSKYDSSLSITDLSNALTRGKDCITYSIHFGYDQQVFCDFLNQYKPKNIIEILDFLKEETKNITKQYVQTNIYHPMMYAM